MAARTICDKMRMGCVNGVGYASGIGFGVITMRRTCPPAHDVLHFGDGPHLDKAARQGDPLPRICATTPNRLRDRVDDQVCVHRSRDVLQIPRIAPR